jgi:hypothetical protein
MSVKIYPEEPCLLPVTYPSNPLIIYGKDYSDIEDVLMCFKSNVSDAEDKYLVKYYKDGTGSGAVSGDVLIDETTHTFTLVKTENDSIKVNPKGYRIFIGVKVTGLTKMLWLRVKECNKIIVEQDGISE